ncbi:MAG: DUF937 domain-containing protein [Ahrensia sp.]|nr:DUF937 domain-containing protein [Ahrensia sp.]
MLPLIEMLTKAQNGDGMSAIAQQFGLSPEQTRAAIEALAPAFSTGLKRNAADPAGVAGFLQALAGGNHAQYFDNLENAFQPQGMAEGNGILGHLFGSKEVSRAVANQASAATGIGSEILKQMLPVIASAVMGGLFKQTTQPQAFGASGGNGNILGQVIEQMMKQSGAATSGQAQNRQSSPRNPNPLDNPFGKILQDMFGGGQSQGQAQPRQQAPAPAPTPNPFDPANNPLGKIFEEMLGGRRQSQPQPQARKDTRQSPNCETEQQPTRQPSKNPYEDLFGDMFETGKQQQDTYRQSVESIFDQYLDGMNRRR